MEFVVPILILLYFGLHIWAVNNKKVMKVLAWLYVVSIVSGVIKATNSYRHEGIESLALIVPCVICFWRAKRPESNKWLEFLGLLSTLATSGALMTYIGASYHHDRMEAVFITLLCAGLTTLFYVLCERKIKGKPIFPKLSFFEKNQSNVQQPVYQQPIIIQQPLNYATAQHPTGTENKAQSPIFIGQEYRDETLYVRLKRLCNPANFVDNYDKEKVEKANQIYRTLEGFSTISNDKCIELIKKAEVELDVNFLDEYQFNQLKDKLNPKNFMQPYDADKVSLSNELYSQLMQLDINYTKFLQIQDKAKSLLEYLRVEEGKKNLESFLQERDGHTSDNYNKSSSDDYTYPSNYY